MKEIEKKVEMEGCWTAGFWGRVTEDNGKTVMVSHYGTHAPEPWYREYLKFTHTVKEAEREYDKYITNPDNFDLRS